jgi:hypothetical protein
MPKSTGNLHDSDRLLVRPRRACHVLDCGTTHLYDLLNAGELESFVDGRARWITVESIRRYIAERLAGPKSKPSPPEVGFAESAAPSPQIPTKVRQRTGNNSPASRGQSLPKKSGDPKVSP